MRCRQVLFFKLMIVLVDLSSAVHCDMATTALVQEGVLGQTPDFNWLGVLRVHLHDGDTTQIAVSGIVLIKEKYALANADDVARIPQAIFQSDTLAMFIPADDAPWFVAPRSYVTHPEYEYATLNTIALVELAFSDDEDSPLNPICFPTGSYNTSSHLYLTGYTDEEKLLEKVIYKIQYLEQYVCEEFYNRAGLSDKRRAPTAYVCGYAPYNSSHCVWDNGMVLVSNATGWFTLIGFGVRGPGCAAPARFIDLAPYVPWIQTATSTGEVYDSPDYRRQEDDEFTPVHKLFTANSSRRQYQLKASVLSREFLKYPFDTEKPRMFNIESSSTGAIAIFPFNTTLEMYIKSCQARRVLLYREIFEVKSPIHMPNMQGSATYMLSMYDLVYKLCSCVELTVQCTHRETASLSFKDTIDFNLGTQMGDSGETPEELFRYYPITERTVKPKTGPSPWKTSPDLKPEFITQNIKSGGVLNYELFIKFEFVGTARLEFALYSTSPTVDTEEGSRRMESPVATKGPATERPVAFWGDREFPGRHPKEPVGRRTKETGDPLEASPLERLRLLQPPASRAPRTPLAAPLILALAYITVTSSRYV